MSEKPARDQPKPRRSAWKSPALWVAVVITLLGAGLWAYAAATKPPAAAAADPNIASGFSASGGVPAAAQAEPRLIDRASPALTRFGACFVAGFCVAYAFKKALKVAAIIAGVVLISLFALRMGGVIDIDWADIQPSIDRSIAWIKGEAGAMKDFILGYLPSAASALAGMVVGLRKG